MTPKPPAAVARELPALADLADDPEPTGDPAYDAQRRAFRALWARQDAAEIAADLAAEKAEYEAEQAAALAAYEEELAR